MAGPGGFDRSRTEVLRVAGSLGFESGRAGRFSIVCYQGSIVWSIGMHRQPLLRFTIMVGSKKVSDLVKYNVLLPELKIPASSSW